MHRQIKSGFVKRLLLIVCLIHLSPSLFPAQEIPVPINLQYSIFVKIFSFDRNLKARVGNEIVLGILYQERYRLSRRTMEEMVEVIENAEEKKIEGIPLRCVPIALTSKSSLVNLLAKNQIDILYLAPLRAFDPTIVTELCQEKNIVTITGVPDYVEVGVAVGLRVDGNKPQILVNLDAAEAEGADFGSQLLKLSKTYRKNDEGEDGI